jgi:hypothetical protein
MKNIEILNETEAKEQGYVPMTIGYNTTEHEQEWFQSALDTFAGCDIVIVELPRSQKEIWRHRRELL